MIDTERIKRLAEWMGWKSAPYGTWLDNTGKPIAFYYWNPLTRIQDAWMLLDKAKDKYCFIWLTYQHEDQPDDGWHCTIGYRPQGKGYDPDSTPEAICQAIEELIEEKPLSHIAKSVTVNSGRMMSGHF